MAGARKAVMSGDRWRMVYQLNSYVNGKVKPVSDAELYGEEEHWAYPTTAGDCEDYVLLKREVLMHLGLPEASLLITVVHDENGEGHAVLTVPTDGGDLGDADRRRAGRVRPGPPHSACGLRCVHEHPGRHR